MKRQKAKLLKIVKKLDKNQQLTPEEINLITSFEKNEKENYYLSLIKKLSVPIAIIIGIALASFSTYFDKYISTLPSWTNLPTPALNGLDYLWGFIGEPVGKANILYHLPNIILYSFGIFGIKKIFDAIDRKTWLDKVLDAKETINKKIVEGNINFLMKKGHSILFVGKGDFIGMQFVLTHSENNAITISETKPNYSAVWNYYDSNTGYEDLENVLKRSDASSSGEYVFFPVKDDQVFLPGPKAFDLSPHKLDILCQDIRTIEKKNKWRAKRIIVIGDKYHESLVHSEDIKTVIKNSKDVISILSISKKYDKITIIDPTDVVLKKITDIAKGRKIVFRATNEGISEYKNRFYTRLKKAGYKQTKKNGILTIGYDILEDLTEQQTLSRKVDDYYPVVLSKTVRDALIRNGYKKENFLYVPELVLSELNKKASEQ